MSNYEYKSVHLGLDITEKESTKPSGIKKLEATIDNVINNMNDHGWEFHSQIELPLTIRPGCIGSLFSSGSTTKNLTVLVFRREIGDEMV
ncbi:MAG: hypothetical protein DHS20C18_44050 [Saprospiraceae bacterium]|nr:MAG: hypothetical protein DHS20C18_44050 [Saprospiraceae bacterium]